MTDMTMSQPAPTALVLMLPGGKPRSTARSRPWQLSNLRMAWFARSLRSRVADRGIAVERVRYRVRGWNEPDRDPVRDAVAALARATERFGDVPVVLVGHSMGGRVAAHIADHPNVHAVAALAPWWPESDAGLIPADRQLTVVHGLRDSWTDPWASREQTARARKRGLKATWLPLPGAGHFMLTKPQWWHQLVADLATDTVLSIGTVLSIDTEPGMNTNENTLIAGPTERVSEHCHE